MSSRNAMQLMRRDIRKFLREALDCGPSSQQHENPLREILVRRDFDLKDALRNITRTGQTVSDIIVVLNEFPIGIEGRASVSTNKI